MKTSNTYALVTDGAVAQYPIYPQHLVTQEPTANILPVTVSGVRPPDTRETAHRLVFSVGAESVTATWESVAKTESQIAAWDQAEADKLAKWRQTASVTRFQARAALHLAGLLEAVETLMQDPNTDMIARLAWQDAQTFKRQSPTVLAMAAVLNLTDAQIDDLFITAAGIEA